MTASKVFGFTPPATSPRPFGEPMVVGVLGGMGPYATLQFLRNVLDLTPATRDWEHVRMVVDSNCHIPSRTRAVLFGEDSPLPGMVDSCQRLMRYPVDVIALPCNSACHWLPELKRVIKTPILNIVELALSALRDVAPVQRITALSGDVPYRTELYGIATRSRNIDYVSISEDDQRRVVGYIESVKSIGGAGPQERERFAEFVNDLARRYQLDGVILACTEFSILWDTECSVPVVDSSRALAQAVVDTAYHGRPLALEVDAIRQFWEERARCAQDGETGLLQATMLTASEEEARVRMEAEREALLLVLSPLLTSTSRVLELGCGTGRWTRILAPHVGFVDAWDYSEGLLQLARKKTEEVGLENVSYSQGSVQDVIGVGTYDLVLSVALLHYLSEEQFVGAMRVVRQNVPVGGHAVFRETFGVVRRFELHGFYSATLDQPYHAVYRTVRELTAALGDDFEMISNQTTLAPTVEKPETAQGAVVFRRVHASR